MSLLPQNVSILVVNGVEGPSVYINDYRVAGPKPWGGGSAVVQIQTDPFSILEGLVGRQEPADIDADINDAVAWHAERRRKQRPVLIAAVDALLASSLGEDE
jgi:hypothetical protein